MRSRSSTVKSQLESRAGKQLRNLLPDKDKVQIMEFLLQCPYGELQSYRNAQLPTFVVECVLMLQEERLEEYMKILSLCRSLCDMRK